MEKKNVNVLDKPNPNLTPLRSTINNEQSPSPPSREFAEQSDIITELKKNSFRTPSQRLETFFSFFVKKYFSFLFVPISLRDATTNIWLLTFFFVFQFVL
jgi:hypothetical protein